jgi:Tfp pilus assembly protein PilN
VDPSNGTAKEGRSFSELNSAIGAKSAIVLIAHRSSMVRQVSVPNLPKQQVAPLLQAKLTPLLPAGPQRYVSGFRLAKQAGSAAKLAVVGAVKEDSLRKLSEEAKAAGLNVAALVPAPFGSWLAAQARGVRDGVVVSQEGSDLCIDVISDGELKYSRFCAVPAGGEEFLQEIEQACATAGVATGSVLVLGKIDSLPEGALALPGVEYERAGLGRFVHSPHTVQSQTFNLELPEQVQSQERRKAWAVAQRALFSAIIATGLWGYLLYSKQVVETKNALFIKAHEDRERSNNQRSKLAEDEALRLRRKARLIDLAFDPAQTFGDIVATLGKDSDEKSWVTGISMERGKPMTVRGEAKDGKTVTKFASKLSNEPRLRNVKLMFTNKAQMQNNPVIQFAISGMPVGNLPFDAEVSLDKGKDGKPVTKVAMK